MFVRFLACLLLLATSPITWAEVLCVTKDHAAIEMAGAVCCTSLTQQEAAQVEAGGCGPCVDVELAVPAAFERGHANEAGNPQGLWPNALLPATASSALSRLRPIRLSEAKASDVSAAPPLLSPLRC